MSEGARFPVALLLLALGAARASAQAAPVVPPSLYTPEQAARGEAVYQNVCIECHETLQYTSPDFKRKWNGRTAYALFDVLSNTMPDKNPGSLPRQDYVDVLAYMMKLNGVAPGKTDLPSVDSLLRTIKLEIPPQPGSAALSLPGPDHTLHARHRRHALVHELL